MEKFLDQKRRTEKGFKAFQLHCKPLTPSLRTQSKAKSKTKRNKEEQNTSTKQRTPAYTADARHKSQATQAKQKRRQDWQRGSWRSSKNTINQQHQRDKLQVKSVQRELCIHAAAEQPLWKASDRVCSKVFEASALR